MCANMCMRAFIRAYVYTIYPDVIHDIPYNSGNLPHMVRMFSMLLAPWTIMFFIQLLPSIGYFVMAIQVIAATIVPLVHLSTRVTAYIIRFIRYIYIYYI